MNTSINTSTDLSALSKRFSNLKKKHDTNIYSEERDTEFPLWALLIIYEKSHHDQFIDHNSMFKQFIKWLNPIVYKLKAPNTYDRNILSSYEVSNIGRLAGFTREEVYECVYTEVLPRLAGTPKADWNLNDIGHKRLRGETNE